eukprot:TRINITY_DN2759_c0_g1_i1.p1 TRINITY_DN2759_c0_g1~~TRINITY_DN2759_c0_g1_i1.p1  ORF type:complete len:206 (+),score=35.61 TRINITY_DN2759_c0_g1_i1:136-753(+)
MVLYFESCNPEYRMYMGRDKYENEELIKYGFPEDVWFHVDNLSSAHVYLRLKKGADIKNIPPDVLEDCVQLVKANSIEGNKKDNISVCYTWWSNLKKTAGMDVGQVGFHDEKLVYHVKVPKRVNMIVNRLNKTKQERDPDLAGERAMRDLEDKNERKKAILEQKRIEKEQIEEKKAQAELKSYSALMKTDKMTSNKDAPEDDDFM